jgi:hypothetical protein
MIPNGGFHQMRDNDSHKGAFEEDNPHDKPQTSLAGQLPHRGADPLTQGLDTDFPEPGENPEHSGQSGDVKARQNAEGDTQDQDPGDRQKQIQSKTKGDLLAS